MNGVFGAFPVFVEKAEAVRRGQKTLHGQNAVDAGGIANSAEKTTTMAGEGGSVTSVMQHRVGARGGVEARWM